MFFRRSVQFFSCVSCSVALSSHMVRYFNRVATISQEASTKGCTEKGDDKKRFLASSIYSCVPI